MEVIATKIKRSLSIQTDNDDVEEDKEPPCEDNDEKEEDGV